MMTIPNIVFLVCLTLIFFLMYLPFAHRIKIWPFKKNPEPEKKSDHPPVKPTVRQICTEVLLVNNSTDKEYILKSDNEFGMLIDIVDNYIVINQKRSKEKTAWNAKARLCGFSIISVAFKEVIDPPPIDNATTKEE